MTKETDDKTICIIEPTNHKVDRVSVLGIIATAVRNKGDKKNGNTTKRRNWVRG